MNPIILLPSPVILTSLLDTDGLWADEWDVDMGVYEGHRGDKDARDTAEKRESEQFRKYGDVEEEVGDFERHTKVTSRSDESRL